jgi:SAM-dependent methyltransferase
MVDSPKKVAEHFSINPAKYAGNYGEITAEGYSFRVRMWRLLEQLGSGSGKVLDIGCGPAVMTKEIMDLGWSYAGVDISEAMITEAKKLAPEASFSVGTVEKIAAQNETYDAVVAMGLVEYVVDDVKAIQEINRVLRRGGRLIVSLPNWWSPLRKWDALIIAPLGTLIRKIRGVHKSHVFHREYTVRGYSKLLEDNGFEVKKVVYYNFRLLPRPFDYWLPKTAVETAAILEPLRNTPLRFWATGFNIEAVKK